MLRVMYCDVRVCIAVYWDVYGHGTMVYGDVRYCGVSWCIRMAYKHVSVRTG
jgi:hypothetical protein